MAKHSILPCVFSSFIFAVKLEKLKRIILSFYYYFLNLNLDSLQFPVELDVQDDPTCYYNYFLAHFLLYM